MLVRGVEEELVTNQEHTATTSSRAVAIMPHDVCTYFTFQIECGVIFTFIKKVNFSTCLM